MLKAGSIFFLAAMVIGTAAHNVWLRGKAVDLQTRNEELLIADTANKATIEALEARIRITEAVILERNKQVTEARRRADAATAELERLQNENPNIAAWSRDAVPGDVLRLLQDRVCQAGRDGEGDPAGHADADR